MCTRKEVMVLNLNIRLAEINWDSLFMTLKYAGVMILILALVFVIARVTPWLAKKVQKILPKKESPERVENDVKGIYDPQIDNKTDDEKIENDGDADKNG